MLEIELAHGGRWSLACPIHDRMPLDSEPKDYQAVTENPFTDDAFEVYPVSKATNSPRNDSPGLAARIDYDLPRIRKRLARPSRS